MAISDAARKLILDAEGLSAKPDWPGGQSGVTIGFGYDLGYVTVDQFESDWGEVLHAPAPARLKEVIGLRTLRAKNRIASLADIRITRAQAEQVFTARTLPLYEFRTVQAFPGVDKLPEDARGALVSLVYNRGTSMTDHCANGRKTPPRRRIFAAIWWRTPWADWCVAPFCRTPSWVRTKRGAAWTKSSPMPHRTTASTWRGSIFRVG